jgi:membrane-bound acyltransferase YfiQ involved in biofilm formation
MVYGQFKFPFSDFTFIYIVIFLIVLFFLKKLSVKQVSSKIDKDTSNLLKGFLILTVVLHHMIQRLVDPGVLKVYYEVGYLSVGMFFLLSGYGLSVSQKNESFISFIKKKLTRVYFPCLIINILLFLSLSLKLNPLEAITPTGIDSTQWFITIILLFYCFQFIATKVKFDNVTFITLSTISYIIISYFIGLGFWWYISSLCFPLGFIWHRNQNIIDNLLAKLTLVHMLLILLCSVLMLLLKWKNPLFGIISCPLFCFCVLVCISKFKFESKFISLVGACSLEIYVLHMKLMWYLEYYLSSNDFSGSFWVVPYFIVLISTSYVFYKINNYVLKLVK